VVRHGKPRRNPLGPVAPRAYPGADMAESTARPGRQGRRGRAGANRRTPTQLAARRGAVPPITFPADLPVSARVDDLAAAIEQHQVVIVAGETGSGKSTQLPKICLKLGRGVQGMIGHTQPRRIAARALAERIAEETGTRLGDAIGYTIRFGDHTSDRTLVKLMTDGILLAEIARDADLRRYDTIIIDEAHERSLNIDFLLGYLARLLPRRPDLKVIVTSATIDPDRFSRHFGGAPVVEVSGRMYPVEIRYRPYGPYDGDGDTDDTDTDEIDDTGDDDVTGGGSADGSGRVGRSGRSAAGPGAHGPRGGRGGPDGGRHRQAGGPAGDADGDDGADQSTAIVRAVDELFTAGDGDILIFLSGEREITDTAEILRGHLAGRGGLAAGTEVLPLYGRLSMAEQHRVFAPSGRRRIVLATNVAETSLTVPGIRYVIDPGTARISRYSPRTKVQRLPIEKISQASAGQRAGRCGRVADGICIRLYAEEDFQSRPEFTDPEIARTSLASVILQMAALGLGDIETFPFLDPPDPRQITDGITVLTELGALDTAAPRRGRGPDGDGVDGDRVASDGVAGRREGRSGGDGVDGDRDIPGDAAGRRGGAVRLTPIGRSLAALPVDPRLARIIVEADRRGCLAEILVIVSALAIRDVREYPIEERDKATAAHARFTDASSDFLALVNLWHYLREQAGSLSGNGFRRMCKAEYLHYLRIREWQDLHAQLALVARGLKMDVTASARIPEPGATPEDPQDREPGRAPGRAAPARRRRPSKGSIVPATAAGVARTTKPLRGRGDATQQGRGSATVGVDRAAGRTADATQQGRGSATVGVDRAAVHIALAAGLLSHIGSRIERDEHGARGRDGAARDRRTRPGPREYQGTRGTRFAIWPGSALARSGASFVLAAELVETSRLWARTVASVEPGWIEQVGGDLLRRSYSEPRWSAKRQAVLATEKVMLLGVTLTAARTVQFDRIDPELARELFIRHALVDGELVTHLPFLAANQRALDEVVESERRTRRRDIAIDDEALFALYDERIPAHVTSGRHLESWWRKESREHPDLLTFTPEMLVAAGAELAARDAYPDRITAGEVNVELDYVFEPGAADDGVSATVPLAALPSLAPESFPAQVPGLRRDLALALIRSLPKTLRRSFVPAPDFADAALDRIGAGDGPLAGSLAAALTALAGVPVAATDFDYAKVPDHLRMTFTVVDDRGREVAKGKDLAAIQRSLRADSRRAVARVSSDLERTGLTAFPDSGVPRETTGSAAGQPVTGYPALVDEGSTVGIRVFTDRADQARAMRRGTRRMVALAAADVTAKLAGRLGRLSATRGPSAPGAGAALRWDEVLLLATAPHGSATALVADAVDAAIDALLDWAGAPAWDAAAFGAVTAKITGQLERAVLDVLRATAGVLRAGAEAGAAIDDLARRPAAMAAAGAPSGASRAGTGGGPGEGTAGVVAQMRAERDGWLRPGFVTAVGAAHLPDVQRYLRALAVRASRVGENPQRDRERAAEVVDLQHEIDVRLAGLRPERRTDPDVAAVRRLLAEYRVALFAQPMRTAVPVSAKRIRAAVAALPD
jgi:ATP-dependent helicase HrpA